jgi:transposase InsO family protein
VSSQGHPVAQETAVGSGPHRPRTRHGRLDGAVDPAGRGPRPSRPGRPGHEHRTGPPLSDVKKLSGIPAGGGWRIHGRGQAPTVKRSTVGYRFLHTAIDDRTRIAYSEILDNEQATTAAGFWQRAYTWFAGHGIRVERALTDNGSCYRSRAWRDALAETDTVHKRTRPYRPQTNGKVERFHRILLEEWAYIRDWTSDQQRTAAYDGFMHFYNRHRSHGALGWATPMATLDRLLRDNVPVMHN